MEQKTLTGSPRTELRTSMARRLRREGKIPAVIYGHREPQPVTIDAVQFSRTFRVISESQIFTLTVGDQSYEVLIKDYQEDILTGRVEHIDFFEFEAGKVLRTRISIHLVGASAGVREGGILEQPLHEIDVECLPKDIPQFFEVDISALGIGDSVHVSDLTAPEGVRILSGDDQTIVLVAAQRAEVVVEEEEAEAEEGEAASEEAETETETGE